VEVRCRLPQLVQQALALVLAPSDVHGERWFRRRHDGRKL